MNSNPQKTLNLWHEPKRQVILVVFILLTLFFVGIILNRSWLSDDSYITFRVVDNFQQGYGLRWNVRERVQVFTHPLWMFSIAVLHGFTGEVYLTSIFFSVFLSVSTLLVFYILDQKNPAIWLGIVLLSFSSAFVDYSTSGLENPLSHFLLIGFMLLYFRFCEGEDNHERYLLGASFFAGLGCFNRLDYVLIYLPALVYMVILSKSKWKATGSIVIGFLPFILWMFFSTIYYGFSLPNTVYAKLGNWLTKRELVYQGLRYLKHTFVNDPVSGAILIAGFGMNYYHRSSKRFMLTVGGLLYVAYILWIGGDFMEGRFLTGLVLIFVVQLVHFDLQTIKILHYLWIIILLVLINLQASVPTFTRNSDYEEPWLDGIVNERLFYAGDTGLFRNGVFNIEPTFSWVEDGKKLKENCLIGNCVTELDSVGFAGYYAGPDVYIVDRLGLGSALMARIPPTVTPDWRIGHFSRDIPEGYLQYLETGDPMCIKVADIRLYVEKLEVLTEGKVFTSDRMAIMKAFWFDEYDSLIKKE